MTDTEKIRLLTETLIDLHDDVKRCIEERTVPTTFYLQGAEKALATAAESSSLEPGHAIKLTEADGEYIRVHKSVWEHMQREEQATPEVVSASREFPMNEFLEYCIIKPMKFEVKCAKWAWDHAHKTASQPSNLDAVIALVKAAKAAIEYVKGNSMGILAREEQRALEKALEAIGPLDGSSK